MRAAGDVSWAQLDFQERQYEEWKAIFGDIQENLSGYYKTLTPEVQAATNLQAIQREYQVSRDNIQRQLAQRGISDSGVMAQAATDLEMARAQQSATARAMAPQQVAQQQSAFLGLGLGQQGALQAGIANAYSQQAQLSMQQAGVYGQQAAVAGQGYGQAIGAIGNIAGQLVGSFGTAQQPSASNYQPTQYQSAMGTNTNWYSSLY
jgi:hypothetical protein